MKELRISLGKSLGRLEKWFGNVRAIYEPSLPDPQSRDNAPTSASSREERGRQAKKRAALLRALFKLKAVREGAELARRQVPKVHLGIVIENRAAELRMRAEQATGQILEHLAHHGGDHRSASGVKWRLKLVDLDITRKQSAIWRREASLGDATFERYLADSKRRGARLATVDFLRFGELVERRTAKGRP